MDQETEGRLTNEIKAIRKYESALLNLYTDYVEILVNNKHDPTCFKCMCNLIKAKPHFNYMDKLAGYVIAGTTMYPELVEGVLEEIFSSWEDEMKKCALRELLLLLKRASWKKIPAKIVTALEYIHLGELKTLKEKREEKPPPVGKKRRRNEKYEKE